MAITFRCLATELDIAFHGMTLVLCRARGSHADVQPPMLDGGLDNVATLR